MSKLEGKVALVTGGASGIGRGIVSAFAREGAEVMVVDIDGEGAAAIADEIGEAARSRPCDVSVSGQVGESVAATVEAFGGLDVMVNNAGIELYGTLLEMPEEDFERSIAVNLTGVFHGIKHAAPAITQRGGGAMVNTASVAATGGIPVIGAYCAAKAGVVQLTRVAALELRDAGIRVNALLPGFIDTPMVERARPMFEELLGTDLDEFVTASQGRWGRPEDVAGRDELVRPRRPPRSRSRGACRRRRGRRPRRCRRRGRR